MEQMTQSIHETPGAVVGLNKTCTDETTKALNFLLANEYALFTKVLNYHWNITGPRFHSLHSLLEDEYKKLLEIMDDLAERVRILGGTPLSTVKQMGKAMTLSEKSGESLSGNDMLSDLLESNFVIQKEIKHFLSNKNLEKDPGTEDFLVGILQKHEFTSWMFRSHLD